MKRGALFTALLLASAALAYGDGIHVEFTGEKDYSAHALRDLLPDEPEKLKDDEIAYWAQDAAYDLEQMYQSHGYFQVAVRPVTEKPDPAKQDWKVGFDVHEGPRYRFGAVRVLVNGDSGAGIPEISLEAREDHFYEEDAVVRDVREVVRSFGNAGFVRAEVKQEIVLRDSLARADVTYRTERGRAVVFDTLRVVIRRSGAADTLEGLTRESLLRSLVPYKRGDTLRADQSDGVIEKLQSTGLYNSVRLEDTLRSDGSAGSVVTLAVEEKIPGQALASLFYETQYGFGVSLNASHSNVAGTMKEVRLGTIMAQDKQSFSAGYGSPLFLGLLLRFDDDAVVEWFQDNLPAAATFSGDFHASNTGSLSRNFTPWLRGVSGVELEYKSTVVADSTGALSREAGGILNVTNTAFFSFLDQPLNPARGARFSLTWGNGGAIFERREVGISPDRANWLEAKSAYYYYLPPWSQFKTAFRLDGGRFFGDGGQNADLFFLGGPRSLRSYGFEQLCPDAPPPTEGSCPQEEVPLEPAYFLVSAELRLDLFDFPYIDPRGFSKFLKPLEIVPFVDYGKVWNLLGSQPSLFSREFFSTGYGRGIAYGGGIRYPLLGIFNFRLDLAWGRPGGSNWPDQWLVDLAQAF